MLKLRILNKTFDHSLSSQIKIINNENKKELKDIITEKFVYTNYQGVNRNILLLINYIDDEVIIESIRKSTGNVDIEDEFMKLNFYDFRNAILKIVN